MRQDTSISFLRVAPILFLLYVTWGGTYVCYSIALQTFGPFLCAGMRSLLGGVLLILFLMLTGRWQRPSLPTLGRWAMLAVPMVVFGTGFIGLGQTQATPAVASVVTGSTPIIMICASCLFLREQLPSKLQAVGLCLGSAAIVFLGVTSSAAPAPGSQVLGICILLLSACGWVAGSVYIKKCPEKESLPGLESTGIMLAIGGIECLIIALLHGEASCVHWEAFRPATVAALLWMGIGGSLIAYSCYTWLLSNVPTAVAVSYEYVVPFIGIFLAWLICGEHISAGILGACCCTAVSVFLILTQGQGTPHVRHRNILERYLLQRKMHAQVSAVRRDA